MSQIFISYKREDISEDFIQHLRERLENEGFDVWIDKELLLPGQDWKKEIDNAIKASIALIVIMTPDARKSEYVTYEWAFAAGRGIPVIPIIIKQTELHPRLNDVQYVDFTNAWGDAEFNWDKLIASLRIEVEKLEQREIPNAILEAIQDLDKSDLNQRASGLDALEGAYPHPMATRGLMDAVNHVFADVRTGAIIRLRNLDIKESALQIANRIEDMDVGVRKEAVEALGKLDVNSTIPHLIKALGDSTHSIVNIASKTLVRMKYENIVQQLLQVLEDEEAQIEIRQRIIDILTQKRANEAVPTVQKYLKHTRDKLRGGALRFFFNIYSADAMPEVNILLNDENVNIAKQAIGLIGKYNYAVAVDKLATLLQDTENVTLKESIIIALGVMINKEANDIALNEIEFLKSQVTSTKDEKQVIVSRIRKHLRSRGSDYIKSQILNF